MLLRMSPSNREVACSASGGSIVNGTEMRAELFVAIRSLAEVVPEMPAGQLMAPLGKLCVGLHDRVLREATDAELLEAASQFRRLEAARVARVGQGA